MRMALRLQFFDLPIKKAFEEPFDPDNFPWEFDNYITTLINCNPKNLYFEKCFFDNEYYYVVTELNNFFEYVIDIETLEYVL